MIMGVIAKFCGGTQYDAKDYGNILQIRETGFTSKAPCLKNHTTLFRGTVP
jgi:hypothetical protein